MDGANCARDRTVTRHSSEGIMRADIATRNGRVFQPGQVEQIEPNQVTNTTIDFWRPHRQRLRQGTIRIRVEVPAATSPLLRNLNTGADKCGLESNSVVDGKKLFTQLIIHRTWYAVIPSGKKAQRSADTADPAVFQQRNQELVVRIADRRFRGFSGRVPLQRLEKNFPLRFSSRRVATSQKPTRR